MPSALITKPAEQPDETLDAQESPDKGKWVVPQVGVPFLGGPFKGTLFYFGYKGGTPILGSAKNVFN